MYHEGFGDFLVENIEALAEEYGLPAHLTARELYDYDQDFVWYCREAFDNAIAGQQAKQESLTYDLTT